MAVTQYARRYRCDLCAAEAETTGPGGGPAGWMMAQMFHDGAPYSLNLCPASAELPYRQVAEQLAAMLAAAAVADRGQ